LQKKQCVSCITEASVSDYLVIHILYCEHRSSLSSENVDILQYLGD